MTKTIAPPISEAKMKNYVEEAEKHKKIRTLEQTQKCKTKKDDEDRDVKFGSILKRCKG